MDNSGGGGGAGVNGLAPPPPPQQTGNTSPAANGTPSGNGGSNGSGTVGGGGGASTNSSNNNNNNDTSSHGGSNNSGRSTPSNASDNSPGKLFVGGLSWQTTQEKLRDYFSQFGTVTDVLVMKDPVTQVSQSTSQCFLATTCRLQRPATRFFLGCVNSHPAVTADYAT